MAYKKIFTTVLFMFTMVLVLVGVPASAQFSIPNAPNSAGAVISGFSSRNVSTNNIQATILNVANIVIGIVAAISVFYIVYGAVTWMNKGSKEGQEIVVNALIGLIIAVFAFVIVQFALGAGGWLSGLFTST